MPRQTASQGSNVRTSGGGQGKVVATWNADNGMRSSGHHGLVRLDNGQRVTADLSKVSVVSGSGSGQGHQGGKGGQQHHGGGGKGSGNGKSFA